MTAALVDTDSLSGIMRKNPDALQHAHKYLEQHARLTISLMTRYEILRGLSAKRAAAQLRAFDRFCEANAVLEITDQIIVRAAGIYGELRRSGIVIGDGDIIIAATAIDHGLVLVTNNTKHFSRIPGLQLENWLLPAH